MKKVTKSQKYLIVFLLSLFISLSANEHIQNYKIGVLSLAKKEQTLKKWEATANYLSNSIQNTTFTIIPMTYDEINSAIRKSEIDFLLTNPAHYIIHEKEVYLFRLATVIYSKKGRDISSFGGVMVALKDNSEINKIEDLEDKRIAAVKKGSLGGYQAQLKEMLDNNLPLPDPDKVTFTDMPHQKTLDLLIQKKVDVAFLRTSVLEKLSQNKEIDINNFKIINRKNKHYLFLTSTKLYPEWPFAALSHIDNDMKKVVAEALFDLKQTNPAAIKGNYKGWYIPLDYNVVTELLRELKLPPFDQVTNFTIKDIIKKYINLFIILIIATILLLIYLTIVNIILYKNKKRLNKLNVNLNKMVEEKVAEIREKDQKLLEQSKMASMGEMIGNIAHQWRQPLSIISTCSSGIQLQKNLNMLTDDQMHEMLNQINKQSDFLSKTIDTFQNFIKEDKKLSEVILQERIDAALNIISTTVKNNHINLINTIDYSKPIHTKIVVGELAQVIMNIINNAKDVLLDKKIDDAWIKIDLTHDDANVVIGIEDNGGGIPEDIMPKIFDPYFTTKHKSQGTGLGLHMSYHIVTDSLQGRIWAQNTSYGAKFFIELPLS